MQMSATRLTWKVWTMPGNNRTGEGTLLGNSVENLCGMILTRMRKVCWIDLKCYVLVLEYGGLVL